MPKTIGQSFIRQGLAAGFGIDTGIAENAKEFTRQLTGIAAFVDGSIDKIIRKTVFDLYSRIVQRTPVDTGRAKANWSVSVAPGSETYPDSSRKLKPADIEWQEYDNVIYIYNNLEYIAALESGHSRQAPVGMVAVSLIDFNDFLRQNINELGGGALENG